MVFMARVAFKIRRSTVFRVCGVSRNLLWDVGAWVFG